MLRPEPPNLNHPDILIRSQDMSRPSGSAQKNKKSSLESAPSRFRWLCIDHGRGFPQSHDQSIGCLQGGPPKSWICCFTTSSAIPPGSIPSFTNARPLGDTPDLDTWRGMVAYNTFARHIAIICHWCFTLP